MSAQAELTPSKTADSTAVAQQYTEQSLAKGQSREDVGTVMTVRGRTDTSQTKSKATSPATVAIKRKADRTVEGPQISRVGDLHAYGDAFIGNDDGQLVKLTFVCFIDNNDNAYFGQTPVSKFDLTPKVLRECLKRIPDENIYPAVPPKITLFRSPVRRSHYIKRPDLKSWDECEGTNFLRDLFLGEVATFELLNKSPHPNIVRYHGCIVDRGRIIGIVLDRLNRTLQEGFQDKSRNFDKELVFKGVECAVEHLHSLGLAHNDLNPSNIMLDKDDRPVLIDLGSCKPFGERLMEAGTEGWIDDHSHISERRHDKNALRKILAWLEDEMASR